jgi:DNA-binding NtrC family response regulator
MKAIMSDYDKVILLIDNDTIFLEKLKTLLENEGYQRVYIATNCIDALSFIKDSGDLFIITEFQFKIMDGEALLRKIKRKLNSKMKVIVLSETTKLSDSFKTMRLGALTFINKHEKGWKSTLNDSLRTWIDYYNHQEFIRQEFKQNLYA